MKTFSFIISEIIVFAFVWFFFEVTTHAYFLPYVCAAVASALCITPLQKFWQINKK